MKLVTYSDTALLVGDEAADLLIRYASRLANVGRADVVVVRALGTLGASVDVTFLLDTGTVMLAESAESHLSEPDNSTAILYMRERMHALEQPLRAVRMTDAELGEVNQFHFE